MDINNSRNPEVFIVETLKRTSLYEAHKALGARLIDFAGFEMPVRYSGVLEEHMAVREHAGMFDVSHMGEILVSGPDARDFLQRVITNDLARIDTGQALYTVMCQDDGGIIDDLLVYQLSSTDYMLVVNAANREKDLDWLQTHAFGNVECVDLSDTTALIAIQGPRSRNILEKATSLSFQELGSFHFQQFGDAAFSGARDVLISATGYTGEKGFEIYLESEGAEAVWNLLLATGEEMGLKPAGLSARDTLRMEAGFCLYGNDITESTTPLEAGLGWVTTLSKESFIGKEALVAQKEKGVSRRLVGFVMEDRGIPRRGFPILSENGEAIGAVTSGSQSPVRKNGIGLGYVTNDTHYTSPGNSIWIDIRGKSLQATIKKPPLHK